MKKLFLTLVFTLVAFTANAQTYTYDVNGDGEINITDVACLVNKILGVPNPGEEQQPQAYLTCPDDHHPHLIDLGLPSGTKWACCNVGADKPEANGGYYAWGETNEKTSYTPSNYRFADEATDDWGNYKDFDEKWYIYSNFLSEFAGTEYDVAYVKWDGWWMTPNYEQIEELIDNCSYVWSNMNGVHGGLFTSSNGGKIFLPAAGEHSYYSLDGIGAYGSYWSSTLASPMTDAYGIGMNSNYASSSYIFRHEGCSVRPVYSNSTPKPLVVSMNSVEIRVGKGATVEITSGNNIYTVNCTDNNVATATLSGDGIVGISVYVKAVGAGTATVTVKDAKSGQTATIDVTVIADPAS